MNKEVITNSVNETKLLGKRIASVLSAGDVLCLAGDLGAGKTSFSQGVAQGLEIKRYITSPTFNIIKEYDDGRLPLYHFDVYRLDCPEQLYDLGYEDYFYGDGITLIEWPEKIGPILPEANLWVDFAFGRSPEQRRILFTPNGNRYIKLLSEVNLF